MEGIDRSSERCAGDRNFLIVRDPGRTPGLYAMTRVASSVQSVEELQEHAYQAIRGEGSDALPEVSVRGIVLARLCDEEDD